MTNKADPCSQGTLKDGTGDEYAVVMHLVHGTKVVILTHHFLRL